MPKAQTPVTPRRSSVARVGVDFFDPAGVEQLRRVLTEKSNHDLRTETSIPSVEHLESKEKQESTSSTSSTITLTGLKVEDGFDFEKTLRYIVRKREAAQIKGRELGVMFRDLRVKGLGASASYIPTLGSMFNPSSILEAIQNARHPSVRDLLSGFEGAVRPGEMVLVLGMPGAGCSTFLKTLANLREEYYAVEGSVYYDSISPEDLKNHFRGDVQYCPEDDVHFPTLTVDQTLAFSAKTRTPHVRIEHTKEEYMKLITDIVITVFGLNHARKTPVGDAAIRGISGGEKKRVSIAEALATRCCITSWDNSTRGLDSSTALEFVRALRIATDTFRLSSILCLYQAGESLYRHFDKVCVIYEGRMAYYGPANQARQYFIDMGYEPANRQTTAEFLVSVTNPNGRISPAGVTSIPRTAVEFADYFKKSEQGRANRADTDSYYSEFVGKPKRASAYIESAQGEHANGFKKESPYLITIPMQARAVMLRRLQILMGDKLVTGLTLFSFVFQALIVGSVYFKSPHATSAYFSRGGVLFFALLFAALTAMSEISGLYKQRPIIHRHKNAALYHPFVEALALTLVDVPITFVTSGVFGVVLYFMVGLQRSASQFFIFMLFLFVMALATKAWFRGLAAACKSEAMAQTFAGISVLVMVIYTGYVIPKPSMIGALRWLTYINPIRYGFEVLLTNEFRTLRGVCSSLVPQGPGYEAVQLANQVCTMVGSLPGQSFVDGTRFAQLSYGYSFSHTWMNFGIVIGFSVGFVIALLVLTEFNTSVAGETSALLFKRGSTTKVIQSPDNSDEEMLQLQEKIALSGTNTKVDTEKKPQYAPTDIFSWQHIDYTVPISGHQDRQLLSNISGYVAPGKLTALMGESGAGKTTLLNVLAQRVNVGVVNGDIFVNGQSLPMDFQSQTGYCQQSDTHLSTATVREALLFSAKLRQPTSVPIAEKEAYVEKCLRMCGLEAYADASVGSLGVEFRKRTTIGVELAAKPKLLLFLDEPTSGLDSQSAWSIISFLRSLADNGQAILCTIHQPSAELFQVFDKLLLLRKGGQTVYFGDLGHNTSTLIDYLESNGSRKCQPDENPAEFMLDVIGAGATATSEQDWHQIWSASKTAAELQRDLDNIHSEGRNCPPVEAIIHSQFVTPWLYQTGQLLKRDAEAHWRDPNYLIAKLALNIFGGLFTGFTFFHSQDSQQGTQNKLFAIFIATVLSVPLANQLQIPYIYMRTIYEVRERPSRVYSWTALLSSQILSELPWNILGSSIFFLCWYWTVGFDSSRAGYTYLMYGVVFPLYYTTIGQAVASVSPTAEIAAILFSLLFTFVIVFNGVLQPFRVLGWWQWMHRLSPFSYLIEGILGQAIGRQQVNCSPIEFVNITPPSGQSCGQYMTPFISRVGGYLTNPNATSSCQFCTVRTTDELIGTNFDIFYNHRWRNLGFMMVYITFNVFCVFALTYLFRIRTGSLLPSFRRIKKTNARYATDLSRTSSTQIRNT